MSFSLGLRLDETKRSFFPPTVWTIYRLRPTKLCLPIKTFQKKKTDFRKMYKRNPFPQKIEIKERISSCQDDFTLNNEQRDKIKKFRD